MTDLTQDAIAMPAGAPLVQATTAAPLRSHPLRFRNKAIYGTGNLVETVINAVLTNFHLFYLTAVCGLSGTLAGASVFIALAVDAFVDPVVGYLSDNTHSRLGRRHPYLIGAAIPVAVAFGLLFSIPAMFKGWSLFAYSTAMLLCMRFALSTFVVPYMAMGGELTGDYHERSVVVTYRHFFGIIGGIVPVILGLPLFLRGDNVLLRSAYIPYAWCCAAIVLGGAILSSFGSFDTIPRLHKTDPAAERRNPGREIVEVFRNRSFVVLFTALLFFFVAQGAAAVLALHSGKFFWNLPTGIIASLQILYPTGMALALPIVIAASRRLEKRTLVLGGEVVFCLLQGVPPLLRIAGLLPPNGPLLYGILGTQMAVVGATITALVIGFQSMMADAADEHDYLFNARREGVYFAGLSFSIKLTAGAGGFIAGLALDAIGFPSAWVSAHPHAIAHLGADVTRDLGLIAGPMPAAITLLCVAIMWFYRIDRARHAEIQTALLARRGKI